MLSKGRTRADDDEANQQSNWNPPRPPKHSRPKLPRGPKEACPEQDDIEDGRPADRVFTRSCVNRCEPV